MGSNSAPRPDPREPSATARRDQSLRNRHASPAIPALTQTELRLLAHLGAGLTHKEIAGELDVSTRTVRRYLSELCVRFDVGTPVEVLVAALKAGAL